MDSNEAVMLGDIRQTVKATGRPYTPHLRAAPDRPA